MEELKDCESQDELGPLISPCTRQVSYDFNPDTGQVKCKHETEDADTCIGVRDAMTYNVEPLATWQVFSITKLSVLYDARLWKMMLRLSGVAVTICIITVFFVPNPEPFKVAKVTQMSKFLNVLVGLLMGFFVSNSMKRWHSCVNGFLQLLDSVRYLQLQFIALGVPEKEAYMCVRWGFASAWLLYGQLLIEHKSSTDRELMWKRLTEKHAPIARSCKSKLLDEREADLLKRTRDPPLIIWTWITSLIGRMAQDGLIPPMQSPTFGRILDLCNRGYDGIREVRESITIEVPLAYPHIMSTLVHINNLLSALALGVVSGLALGTALHAHGLHLHRGHEATTREAAQDGQSMLVTLMCCSIGPVIYQALLVISLNLAQPFASESGKIPMDRLLHQLEIDVCNGRDLVDHLDFEKPYFKAPPPAPAEA